MFRFDLSLFSAQSSIVRHQQERQGIRDRPCDGVSKKKQRRRTIPLTSASTSTSTSFKFPSSPGRTARTQASTQASSSNCSSVIGHTPNKSTTPRNGTSTEDARSVADSSSSGVVPPSPSRQHRQPATTEPFHRSTSTGKRSRGESSKRPPASHDSNNSNNNNNNKGGPSSFSSVGKTVLKSLRNIAVVASSSFDSGTSKTTRRSKKKGKKLQLSVLPREVQVRVVDGEGEGVEVVTTRPASIRDDTPPNENSDHDRSSSIDCDWNRKCDDVQIPKIIRDTSTFATTSLTFGEESDNAEIYQDDTDIRRLCNLMTKIRNGDDEPPNEKMVVVVSKSNFNSSVVEYNNCNSKETVDSGKTEEEGVEVAEETFQAREAAPPPQAAYFDLMIFVNNEHKVLEYAHDEFQKFD